MNPGGESMTCGLYVHIPWCVKKCPYCDFNSHAIREDIPARAYINALLLDLAGEASAGAFGPVDSIFIGGGTPSLLSGTAVSRLMAGIRRELPLTRDCEITLEANPGTLDAKRLDDFRCAGVNRLSIGVQSFDDALLLRIGRIHDGRQARLAVARALDAGFDAINLDLLYGLPGQTLDQGIADVETAIDFGTAHISHYQLTIEPNTLFHRHPPPLPDDDVVSTISEHSIGRLEAAGYRRYEISAFSRSGHACRHNLNYWRFGDYLGIGAGAHGKLTPAGSVPVRSLKIRHPRAYLDAAATRRFDLTREKCSTDSLPLEFMMNALRLIDGISLARFTQTTSLPVDTIRPQLEAGRDRGLLSICNGYIRPTSRGFDFLNELLLLFASPQEPKRARHATAIAPPAYADRRHALT